MPKLATKPEVLEEMVVEHTALEKLIDGSPQESLVMPGVLAAWSAKDILMHLAEWEQMFLGWYRTGCAGQIPVIPAEGYSWRQLSDLNQMIYEKYRHLTLAEALARFRASYLEFRQVVEQMSLEEVAAPDAYPWTNNHPLAGWISSNAGSHYRWARKELAKGLKKLASQ